MALDVLAQGKLLKAAQQRTGASGKPFVTAQLAVSTEAHGAGEADSLLVSVIAFRREVQDALLALGAGDAVAIAGRARLNTWNGTDGALRTGLSVVADGVLTAYHARRKREAMQTSDEAPQPRQSRRPAPARRDAGLPAGFDDPDGPL